MSKSQPDVGWLFGELYTCDSEEQLKKIINIGNICKNSKQKTFYHKFLMQKYESIKDIDSYEREPFTNFEKDISKYAYQQYIRSSIHKDKDSELINFVNSLAQNQYHN